MALKRDCVIVLIVLNAWLCQQLVQGSETYNRDSLDSFLYDYAFKKIRRLRSGKMYNVGPPSNFPGMEVAVARVRTSSLWNKGLSYGSLAIPPKIMPWPFTRRVDVVYQNLANWSSCYYSVPNHRLVAPVMGFLAYDSTNNGLIGLRAMGGHPFVLNFSSIYSNSSDARNVTMSMRYRCVRFDTNGTLELSSMMRESSSCVVREQGHFSVVVPNEAKDDNGVHKWWIMGIAAAVVGLMWLVVVVVFGCKRKKMKKMERESERCEGLDTIWIGRSRMPCASGIRTQPVLENSYLP
ncbi:hypothetical protein C2S51_022228 [Perilla frutescens var. frutescens]|nr:hypothetical protein C2S51_022228 [Perilla frutescens var. frutescens]